jgi:hypothetical protein
MSKFVVAVQRPYYPEIHFVDDAAEAQRVCDEIRERVHVEGARYAGHVTIAEVLATYPIKTNY